MSGHHLLLRSATTEEMLRVYGDDNAVHHALAFEAALARATLPPDLADQIAQACASLQIDGASLAAEAAHAGTLAIPLVARLRGALSGGAAETVHRGATSQDLADTVMVLQAKEAEALLDADLRRTLAGLAALVEQYAETPAMGRTLLQDALPITFGLRAAQWLMGIHQARSAFLHACETALVLQHGGPVGAAPPSELLAAELGLRAPRAPWHARRVALAGLASALGILIGALAKTAGDIALMAQDGIGEAREPERAGRGGSSSMPHKNNPAGGQLALSAAARAPGLVAAFLAGLSHQQFERGLGGWQAEAPVLAELFMLAGASARAMAEVAEGLEVDAAAMARNLAAAGRGAETGESADLARALLAEVREDGDALRDP